MGIHRVKDDELDAVLVEFLDYFTDRKGFSGPSLSRDGHDLVADFEGEFEVIRDDDTGVFGFFGGCAEGDAPVLLGALVVLAGCGRGHGRRAVERGRLAHERRWRDVSFHQWAFFRWATARDWTVTQSNTLSFAYI